MLRRENIFFVCMVFYASIGLFLFPVLRKLGCFFAIKYAHIERQFGLEPSVDNGFGQSARHVVDDAIALHQ